MLTSATAVLAIAITPIVILVLIARITAMDVLVILLVCVVATLVVVIIVAVMIGLLNPRFMIVRRIRMHGVRACAIVCAATVFVGHSLSPELRRNTRQDWQLVGQRPRAALRLLSSRAQPRSERMDTPCRVCGRLGDGLVPAAVVSVASQLLHRMSVL